MVHFFFNFLQKTTTNTKTYTIDTWAMQFDIMIFLKNATKKHYGELGGFPKFTKNSKAHKINSQSFPISIYGICQINHGLHIVYDEYV